MFIRRTIYWIVIPCAKLQKIFGITIKMGNNFGVWGGLRLFDWGSREGLNLVWVGLRGCWLSKTEKTSLLLFFRSSVAHVAVLCACECKRASILKPPNHQPPFGLWTTTRTINQKKHFSVYRKWKCFLSVAMVYCPLGVWPPRVLVWMDLADGKLAYQKTKPFITTRGE